MLVIFLGWDGGIRTPECRHQKPMPYHLATSHYIHGGTDTFALVKRWFFGAVALILFFLSDDKGPMPYHLAVVPLALRIVH